jgi:hypothetical protein
MCPFVALIPLNRLFIRKVTLYESVAHDHHLRRSRGIVIRKNAAMLIFPKDVHD